ncbi:MAG: 23S rRNA (guanosine(2251)-2'-O)-methyltransferase RlmB [Candidatus Eisenbacteria bacterium]
MDTRPDRGFDPFDDDTQFETESWERAALGLDFDAEEGGPAPWASADREDETAPDWVFGRNPVREALDGTRSVLRLLIADGTGGLTSMIDEAREQGVPVQHVPRIHLDRLAQSMRHQGVAAMVAAFDYTTLTDILERAEAASEPAFLLFLDEIQDPQNLGSILRSAEACGVHGVVLPKHRSAGLTAAVARSSAGAIEHIPVARVGNLATTAARLKEQGFWVVGTEASGETDYREVDYRVPIIVAIGGEDRGLGRALAGQCDWVVRLPMRGKVNSLNASVAASIVLYQALASRTPVAVVPRKKRVAAAGKAKKATKKAK